MKCLFRLLSIKAWKGADFISDKCIAYNVIVNQYCAKYYCKCWKHRNEKLHDEEVHRK